MRLLGGSWEAPHTLCPERGGYGWITEDLERCLLRLLGGYWEAPHTLCPERGGYYSVSLPGVVGKTLCATKTSKGVLYIWRRECLKSCTLYFSARCCIILFCPLLYHTFLPAAVSYFSARCRIILFSPLLRHTCLPAIVSCFSARCCIILFCPVLYHTFLPAIVSYFSGRYF